LDNRVTLITGASSGIGAATARRLAKPGDHLMLHARGGVDGSKISQLEKLANEARILGATVETFIGDFADVKTAEELIADTLEKFARLDRIVSNAGYALNKPVGEMTRQDADESYQVITGAFVDLVTAALPHLIKSDCGRIVAVTSFVIDQMPGERLFPATAAAKGALQAFARTLAVQVAADGVTVNCVSPGFTAKETSGHSALSNASWEAAATLAPNRRLAQPADVAAALAFFLSTDAAHITGQTLRVDGGLSLI
jgi:3-oxoacyl-[acyl-carrier protein] reductase